MSPFGRGRNRSGQPFTTTSDEPMIGSCHCGLTLKRTHSLNSPHGNINPQATPMPHELQVASLQDIPDDRDSITRVTTSRPHSRTVGLHRPYANIMHAKGQCNVIASLQRSQGLGLRRPRGGSLVQLLKGRGPVFVIRSADPQVQCSCAGS